MHGSYAAGYAEIVGRGGGGGHHGGYGHGHMAHARERAMQQAMAQAQMDGGGGGDPGDGMDAASGSGGWVHGGYGWHHDGYGTWWHPEHGYWSDPAIGWGHDPYVSGVAPAAPKPVGHPGGRAPAAPKPVGHPGGRRTAFGRPSIMSHGYSAWAQKTLGAAQATSPGWSPTSTGMDAAWHDSAATAYGYDYGAGQAPPPPPRAAAPPALNTWARWQEVHPGSSYQDYQNWWAQYGQHGAAIQPDAHKKGGGFNLGNTLKSIGKVAMTVAPVVAMAAGDGMTGATTITVNPVWADTSRVLAEAATQLRASTPYDAQTTFYTASLVDRLATLAQGLALTPNAAMEADFHGLGHWLSTHPHGQQLADFITSHPALTTVFSAATTAHAAGYDGRPAAPNFGGHPGFGGRPPPPQMNTWNRWQQVHPGTSFQDYRNWQSQYGQYGAQIN